MHLSDNTQLDKNDKYSKLKPFYKIINKKILQFRVFSYNLSMAPYFERHVKCFMINCKGNLCDFGAYILPIKVYFICNYTKKQKNNSWIKK